MIRVHYMFYGSVQGVGFRYRAEYAAMRHRLTGWVRNNWNGAVEMEVQGDEDHIKAMVEEIGRGRFVEIRRIEKNMIPPVDHESSFTVRY